MPRKSRIDAAGALHHVIVRGIERGKIFKDDADRDSFLERLGTILKESDTRCFAWALIPNHFHLLIQTGPVPLATVMRRLLTGHAVYYNRRHRRSGHLFQNRYKSILCQEDVYLLELVRYIHLNPLRVKLIPDLKTLDSYLYSGHSILMGRNENDWQNTQWVLKMYDERIGVARRRYRSFVKKGLEQGHREDLIGGGLIRSAGGWSAVKEMKRSKTFQKSDERILGNSDFVDQVLSKAREQMERKYALQAHGYTLETLAEKASSLMGLEKDEVFNKGKDRVLVSARSLLCYWAVKELGISMAALSRRFEISIAGISLSVKRGEKIARENNYELMTEKL